MGSHLASSLPNVGTSASIDTDGTLAANSDLVVPSQKAVKTYADGKVFIDTDGTLASNLDTKVASQKATKTYADTKMPSSYLDTDGALTANSDTKVASQKAAKTYSDLKLAKASNLSDVANAGTARSNLSVEYIRNNVNIMNPTYGAVGNGTTDDTTAIGNAITAAGAGGVVYMPPGYTFKTTGGHNLDALHGLQIIGGGVGATKIRLAHASNNLFYIGNTHTRNLGISNFSVISDTVTRTGGWVFACIGAYNTGGYLQKSRIQDIEMQDQVNGIWIARYEFVWLVQILGWKWVGTSGVGIKGGQTTATNVNQGSELYIDRCHLYGNDLAGGAPILSYGYYFEDCDAVYMDGSGSGGMLDYGMYYKSNVGGHPSANVFIAESVFDAPKNANAVQFDSVGNIQVSNSWFCSAGQHTGGSAEARGLVFSGCTDVIVSGSRFYNNKGTGLSLFSSNGVVSGCQFRGNGSGAASGNTYAVQVSQTTSGDDSFTITGCMDVGSTGASILSDANSNKLMVVGNRWKSGTSYGVAPLVNEHNSA